MNHELSKKLKNELVNERFFFRKLLSKLIGDDKAEQAEFLIQQARKLSKTTYVQATLKSIPVPPNYSSIERKNRRNYNHIHQLVDLILPIAAGSNSQRSQRTVFLNRWQYLHKQPFVTKEMALQILQDSNKVKDLWKAAELAINLIPAEVDELKRDESNKPDINSERKRAILLNLTEKIFSSKKEAINFYLTKEPSIKSTTYVKMALENLAVPPDFSKITNRLSRRKYADIYSLLDMILPIAAGSKSPSVQLSLIESR